MAWNRPAVDAANQPVWEKAAEGPKLATEQAEQKELAGHGASEEERFKYVEMNLVQR